MPSLLAALLFFSLTATAQTMAFSEVEKARILAHGPWPPEPGRDPSNRVSGKPEAIAFGERLFFEPRLSGTGSVLCATCHVPFRAFQDARAKAFGLQELGLNTPSLINVGLYRWYGWDGAHDTLWAQSVRPLLEPREMRATPAHVAGVVRKYFPSDYQRAFGRAVPADDEEAMFDAAKALAAYQETLISGRTPFDDFRDALEKNDTEGTRRYPIAAQRGLALFVGKADCSGCHVGPQFTNASRRKEVQQPKPGEFRVPGLRNVALTAPYLHDGGLATLREVVNHFAPNLTARESDDLVVFLQSLTDSAQLR